MRRIHRTADEARGATCLCDPCAPPDLVGPHAAAARVALERVRLLPSEETCWCPASSTRGGSSPHQNAAMWGSVETTVKLGLTGLAGFTLACVVIETAGCRRRGLQHRQNYFVTRGNQILRRVPSESSRRPPRQRGACSMA